MAPPTKTSFMLGSGEYFDPYAPDPSVITLDILSRGLANTNRFKGQTTRQIAVDEHCLRVARLAGVIQQCRGLELESPIELAALLHDAHESLTPWGDVPSPLKTEPMRALETDIDIAVYAALGIPMPDTQARQIVGLADLLALYFEAMLWLPGASDWALDVLDRAWGELDRVRFRSELIDMTMPLIAPRPGECWRTEVADLLRNRTPTIEVHQA